MPNNVNTSLTNREQEIASLLACGFSEKEIANRLNITATTVNNHTRNIRNKFGLSKNIEIVLLYIAQKNNKSFNINDIRKNGVDIILR